MASKAVSAILVLAAVARRGAVAQTCSNGLAGIENANACCVLECGVCGGTGCGAALTGGNDGASCCSSEILDAGVTCDEAGAAPCIVAPTLDDTATCDNGLPGYQDGTACCAPTCGQCGGEGCGSIFGTNGASDCCSTDIMTAAEGCSVTGAAPCVIEAVFEPSTCFNGMPGVSDGDVCCVEACGQCGGIGCGTIPGTGGSAECCSSVITAANLTCGVDTTVAPCVMEAGTFTFAPTAAPTAAPSAFPTAAPIVAQPPMPPMP